MRMLGIDFGERRIGLALSDPEGRFALPIAAIERTSDDQAVAAIAELARAHEIGAFAIGEPRRPSDGAATDAARRVRRFGERLGRATGLPLDWIDETHTSQEADARLREAGVPRQARAGRRDSIAAQIVLEEALARRQRARGPV